MLDTLRRRNHVLPSIVLVLGVLFSRLTADLNVALSVCILVFTVFFTYLEIVTQLSFRAPRKRKPSQ